MHSKEQNRPPSILLIHFHSMKNAGDAAQLEAAIENLRQHFHDPQIWVSANHPDERELQALAAKILPSFASLIGMGKKIPSSTQLLQFAKLLLTLLWIWASKGKGQDLQKSSQIGSELFQAYRNADLILSTPGNIFFTMGKIGFPFLCSCLAVLPALIYQKPFYVLPQSIGPLKRWWERWILQRLYQRANLIFVRESVSFRLAKKLKFPMDRVKLTLDLTIHVREPDKDKIPTQLRELDYSTERLSIGVTVIPRMVKSLPQEMIDRYYRNLAGTLSQFVAEKGMDIYFFPQVIGPMPLEDDRFAIREVVSQMTCTAEHIKIISEPIDHRILKQLYQKMDIFLASRLHSGLFALSFGVPTLMIGYLTKTKGVMETLNLEEWLLDIESVNQQTLTQKMEMLLDRRVQVSSQILVNIKEALERSPDPGLEIAKDYYHGIK